MYKQKLKCKCNSEKLHCYFKYKSKGIERFICKDCNKRYEETNGKIKEIPSVELDEMTTKLFKNMIHQLREGIY